MRFWRKKPPRRQQMPPRTDYIKVTVQKMSANGTVLFTIWGKGDDLTAALFNCRGQTKGMFQAVSVTIGEILDGQAADRDGPS